MTWCIYRIKNLINGKTYIGQHRYKKLDDKYMGSGKLIKNAIEKYGRENFTKTILVDEITSRDLADRLEIAYIREFKPDYNLTKGGTGGDVMSPETKRRMSEAMKGRPHTEEWKMKMKGRTPWNKGIPCSEETKKKVSEANKGKTSWNKGKKMSEEFRKKCSESHKGIHPSKETVRKRLETRKGYTHSEETRQKLRESHLREDVRKKKSESVKAAKAEMVEAYRKSGRKDWNAFQKEYKEKK